MNVHIELYYLKNSNQLQDFEQHLTDHSYPFDLFVGSNNDYVIQAKFNSFEDYTAFQDIYKSITNKN